MPDSADTDGRLGRERLEDLFRQHEPAVVSYVRRRVPVDQVEDVVAETFLVAWRRVDEVPESALPWLLGVARRVLAAQRRAAGRRRRLDDRLAASQSRALPNWSDDEDGRALAALAELPEKDREALMLVAWDGLSPQEAATVLGEPGPRFRVRLHRAKRRIKALLDPGEEGPPATEAHFSASPASVRQGAHYE